MRHIASKALWPKLIKALYGIELCVACPCMKTKHLEAPYWINMSEVVATDWKKLMNKLMYFEALLTIARKIKWHQVFSGENINKHSTPHSTGIRKPGGEKIDNVHKQWQCKRCQQKEGSFWLHDNYCPMNKPCA